jgi:hypothetical protein
MTRQETDREILYAICRELDVTPFDFKQIFRNLARANNRSKEVKPCFLCKLISKIKVGRS